MAQLDNASPLCSIGDEDISDISIGELFEWSCKPKDGIMEMTKRFHSKQPNIEIVDSDNVRVYKQNNIALYLSVYIYGANR